MEESSCEKTRSGGCEKRDMPASLDAYGSEWQGPPAQASTAVPPIRRNSDFCSCAAGVLRGEPCGSGPARLGVFVVGARGVMPLSHCSITEPSYGKAAIRGMA